MDASTTTLSAWGYGLAAASYVLLFGYLLSRRGQASEGRVATLLMMAAVLGSALWAVLCLGNLLTGERAYRGAAEVVDALRYAAWYGLVFVLLGLGSAREKRTAPPSRLIIAGVVVIAVAGVVVRGLIWLSGAVLLVVAKAYLILSLAMVVVALLLVEQFFRSLIADSRWNVKPLCLGLAAAFIYDLFLYSDALLFGRIDPDVYSVRGFAYALIVPLLALPVNRSRDWATRLRVSQKVAFHSLALLLSGGYLLFMAGVGYYVRYFGGDWGRALQFALLFVALLAFSILAFSGSMRARVRVFLGKHFLSYRYDYREEWLKFTQTLSEQGSPQTMGLHVIKGLAGMLESPGGGLWLRDGANGPFVQSARWNMPAVAGGEDADSHFSRFLTDSGWVINLEEYRCYSRRYEGLALPEWLMDIPDAWLIVPLLARGEMIGYVVLASARTRVDLNWEVNDLLKTAGRQAAAFLAQLQATEALLEARKFDAFNRMSAFVVHDLKNIVTQLSLMLRNAEKHKDNAEFQEDMLMTVENSVERMRQLMLQLREGATPPGTPVGVDLRGLAERIQKSKATQGRQVEVEVAETLRTRGHEERLERVLGHMVQNALDATDPAGRVWIRLQRQGGQALVEVGDTGHGMSPEFIRERLFKPFQTTKEAGMGIGAYESSQYINELGGKILVDSEVNKGTRVTVLLPLFDGSSRGDLRQEAAP